MRNTPDNISELKENEYFVFGSNRAGLHGGGAARLAYETFGAKWGLGEGLSGKTYAFPTLGFNREKQSKAQIKISVKKLYDCCRKLPDRTFLLTKVGCGIAGFTEEEMKEFFKNSPDNLIKPISW